MISRGTIGPAGRRLHQRQHGTESPVRARPRRLTLTNDQAYDLVISVAAGQLDAVDAIAAILRNATQPRR